MQHQVEASRAAATRIAPYIITTQVQRIRQLSQHCHADIWMKQEYLQHTGSFKLRGALNAIMSLNPTQRARGVVAASSGNHGAAVAYACQIAGCRATIFVPEHAAPVKIAAMRDLGADVRLIGNDSIISESAARDYATAQDLPYISPYNDEVIMAGQGTLALEIIKQIPMLNTVIIAVGGGGLIGGMAAVLKSHNPHMLVIGAQPINSAVMVESVREGAVVHIPSDDTISDGTAGGIESDTITFTNYKRYVDMTVLVSEREIIHSMRDYINQHHHLIEGAAGVALAATTKLGEFLQGRVVAVIGCGAGIGVERLCSVMQDHP